eukprot:CAMPEP_0119052260 /NCGR_PEP_ID=MMETSP1177-20130426/73619_1 /TAXON_ID=2985 /ORGANISM="Ochromonas sp, Strain CCMP1899" /LENGTH=675 /DNA_ID=CAMNT_0007031773 /DNA_START=111 /DNA_END=2138 /DNA_ORIENTATION=+
MKGSEEAQDKFFPPSSIRRNSKIKERRDSIASSRQANVFESRVTSVLSVPSYDGSQLHSSQRCFDRSSSTLSSKSKQGNGTARGLSLDTRLARLRHRSLQAEAEVRFDSALDRTASETLLRLSSSPSPWMPTTCHDRVIHNEVDLFVNSSSSTDMSGNNRSRAYQITKSPLENTDCNDKSPLKNTELSDNSTHSNTLNNDNSSRRINSKDETAVKLIRYRAIRRVPYILGTEPWSTEKKNLNPNLKNSNSRTSIPDTNTDIPDTDIPIDPDTDTDKDMTTDTDIPIDPDTYTDKNTDTDTDIPIDPELNECSNVQEIYNDDYMKNSFYSDYDSESYQDEGWGGGYLQDGDWKSDEDENDSGGGLQKDRTSSSNRHDAEGWDDALYTPSQEGGGGYLQDGDWKSDDVYIQKDHGGGRGLDDYDIHSRQYGDRGKGDEVYIEDNGGKRGLDDYDIHSRPYKDRDDDDIPSRPYEDKGWGDSWLGDGDWKCDDDADGEVGPNSRDVGPNSWDVGLNSREMSLNSREVRPNSLEVELNSRESLSAPAHIDQGSADGVFDVNLTSPSYLVLSVRILRQNTKAIEQGIVILKSGALKRDIYKALDNQFRGILEGILGSDNPEISISHPNNRNPGNRNPDTCNPDNRNPDNRNTDNRNTYHRNPDIRNPDDRNPNINPIKYL